MLETRWQDTLWPYAYGPALPTFHLALSPIKTASDFYAHVYHQTSPKADTGSDVEKDQARRASPKVKRLMRIVDYFLRLLELRRPRSGATGSTFVRRISCLHCQRSTQK